LRSFGAQKQIGKRVVEVCESNYRNHMATETLKVVPVGNSKGVRLPSAVLRRYRIEDEVEMVETTDGILLRPKSRSSEKLSFEQAFAEMAALGTEGTEIEAFDATLSDGLPDDDYSR
jgi:antitoxin MazE